MDTHHHKKLQSYERDHIAKWFNQGISEREIARRLHRSVSTISDEIQRNSHRKAGYVAIHAQLCAQERRKAAGKRHPLKDPHIYAYVLDKLRSGWSPEQIAGKLEDAHQQRVISHEAIYRCIYASESADKKLWEYLPRKHRKRRKHNGRKHHKSRIPDRVSIHMRPLVVNARIAFGHWEGDTLEGKRHRNGIHTEVERRSRFLAAQKVGRIAAAETATAQRTIFHSLPQKACLSTTLDNGHENTAHAFLHSLGMKTYFADPYSSWQRGTNEYHNGLLRRYLPKGTSFDDLSDEELSAIVEEINDRPRKCLRWKTPREAFEKESGVRIGSRM